MGCCFSSDENKEQDRKTFPPVYLRISLDGEHLGQVIIQLFSDVPKTAENFRALCSGERGRDLCYRGSPFHRIIPGFMCQAGDITHFDGSGGKSIYGVFFDDENFKHKHDAPGLLSMANCGKNRNSSQFFILTSKAPWLDGKHVVFGQVVRGMDTVWIIESCGQADGTPKSKVIIEDCGQLITQTHP